jgi:hypothetical protein
VLLHSDILKLAGITWALCRPVSSRVGVKFVVGALLLSVRVIQCFTIKFLNTFFKNMKINSCLHFTDPSYSFCSLTTVFLPASTWVSTLIVLLRYAGVIWLLFLMGYLYFIGLWLDEDQRTNTIKSHV